MHPARDAWGQPFSNSYEKERFLKAGSYIGGENPFYGVMEGIAGDQDFVRVMFDLKQGASHQLVCHYCRAIQWVDSRVPQDGINTPDNLYTVFGETERNAESFGFEHLGHLGIEVQSLILTRSGFN